MFLTLLGGGVFGNRPEWIADAIAGACTKLKDYDLDVRIVVYDGIVPAPVQRVVDAFNNVKYDTLSEKANGNFADDTYLNKCEKNRRKKPKKQTSLFSYFS